MNPDMSKVEAFAGQVVSDIAATFSGVMTNIGHKLGLYKAMAGAGWLSSVQLAEATGEVGASFEVRDEILLETTPAHRRQQSTALRELAGR